MGVESEQLVYAYLSRVGDLAQTALPAAERMQLITQLRKDIERERGGSAAGDDPTAVRRILDRIGTPDEVVETAAGGTDAGRGARTGSGSGSGVGSGSGARSGSRAARRVDAGSVPAAGSPPRVPPPPAQPPAAGSYGPYTKPPGPRTRGDDPEWWQPRGPRTGDELTGLPGMTGGVFFPIDDEELAGRDPLPREIAKEEAEEEAASEEEAAGRRRLLPRLRRARTVPAPAPAAPVAEEAGGGRRRLGSPLLLLAAALLLAGAAIGSWIPLGLGWLAAYLSRGLTRTQAKIAVLGVPGAAAAGLVVWLWGRDAGKWSTPVAQGQMNQAIQDALPGTVRLAAVASALYVLWLARRSA